MIKQFTGQYRFLSKLPPYGHWMIKSLDPLDVHITHHIVAEFKREFARFNLHFRQHKEMPSIIGRGWHLIALTCTNGCQWVHFITQRKSKRSIIIPINIADPTEIATITKNLYEIIIGPNSNPQYYEGIFTENPKGWNACLLYHNY